MTNIYLFRHGQTEWNRIKRFQGHTDVPLNETGRDQAESLQAKVSDLNIDTILSSDLSRAYETALIAFAKLGDLPMIKSPALRECNLGAVEGMLNTDIIAQYGDEMWDQWYSMDKESMQFGWPEGETKQQNLDRVLGFLDDQLSEKNLSSVAVASHGNVVKRLVQYAKKSYGEPVADENCALYHLKWDNKDWQFVTKL